MSARVVTEPAAREDGVTVSQRTYRPTTRELVAALVSAILFGVAYPPFPFVGPVFVCLVPVAVAVARRADAGESWHGAAKIGFWFGLIGYAINLYWMASALHLYTNLAFLGFGAAVVGLAAIVSIAIVVLFWARRATHLPLAILLPVVWVTREVALNHLSDVAFPWLPLGLATAHLPVLAQAADLSGVRGLSFWIAAINGLIADAWMLRAWRSAVVARAGGVAVLVVAVAGYGVWRMSSIRLRPVAPIAIVQPNIPQQEKWQEQNQGRIIGILATLTRERLARDDARLILWPEAALPGFLVSHPEWADTLYAISRTYHTPMIFGVLDVTFLSPNDAEYFNAAMLMDSTGRIGSQPTYHKTYLVPIVERVPFVNPRWFGKLQYFGAFARGGHPVPFTFPFGKVGVLICYESIFAQRSRTYRREGASVLVNITNDAWFGRTIAPYQHESHLVLRAIENRVGIVRAANTGISAYVDPLGRIHGATALFVPTTRTYEAQTTDIRTLYVRWGDWVGMLSVIATLALLIVAAARRRAA